MSSTNTPTRLGCVSCASAGFSCSFVGTPGVGFGECGEGYFRLTAFGDAEKTKEAAQRIKTAIKAL